MKPRKKINKSLKKFARSPVIVRNIMFMFLFNKIYGLKKKKVVFTSFSGKWYSDNPKAISVKLHELYPEFEIVWLFKNPEEKQAIVPAYVRTIKSDSVKALKELATAKFWVDNFGKSKYIYKSKNQVYIQTWHGDRGFKNVLHNVPKNIKKHYLEEKKCDLMTAGSTTGKKKLSTAFVYHGPFLEYGSPRNDQLIEDSQERRNDIKNKLNISVHSKIVLFAPTFRKVNRGKKQCVRELNLAEVLQKLKELTNCDWKCLVRAHPGSSPGLSLEKNKDQNIIDVTMYEDMADLLLIADLLITDYSASAGDFVLKKKPVILFQPDQERYLLEERTFYFNIDESPYMVAKNQEELIERIIVLNEKTAKKNCEDILSFYGAYETGKASEKVVEYMHSES